MVADEWSKVEAAILLGMVEPGSVEPRGGRAGKFWATVDGRFEVLVKPAWGANEHNPAQGFEELEALLLEPLDGDRLARNEVAAWELAKLLGWSDLVPVTCLRSDLVGPDGRPSGLASVQVQVPERPVSVESYDSLSVARAGVFDVLVGIPDRFVGNWLWVEEPGGSPRVVLIDNELAFMGEPVLSPFADRLTGGDFLLTAADLASQSASWPPAVLADLLPSESLASIGFRIEALLDSSLCC